MIKTLPFLILSCIGAGLEFLRIAIIKALLPRMPLPNWSKEVRVGQKVWKRVSRNRNLGNYFEFTNSDNKTIRFKISTRSVGRVNVTPTKPTVVNFGYSIYSDPAPQDTRHLLTPLRSPMMAIREVSLTLLKNASDRVGEILRENRRRLDAGEDPSTVRKEARRKRAMEIAARTKGQARLFS